MAEVFEPVIEIKTGNSEQTVKGLKKEISDLRDAILNLEQGSDAYNDAVEKLQEDQRKLNEVMALTKKEATALEGSYDALVHQMSQLKKEWRATNDEAKRNEIGKQIDEINAQLKEMDASVGNFQRNVGNYVSHWEGMPEVTKDFGAAMAEMNQKIEPTKQKFESVGKIASGLASGFAVVQGSMALLGVESEDLEKTFVKLQAAMAIMQGVKGIGDLVEGVGKAKVAFADLGTEVKNVSKAMGKTGWLAVILLVITAITTLVAHIQKKNREIKDGTTALKEYNKVGKEAASNAAEETIKLELLNRVATDVTMSMDKRRKAAEKLLTALGMEVNETNILAAVNGDLKTKVDAATQSLIRQAMVAAQVEKLTELYKEFIDLQNGVVEFDLGEKIKIGANMILGDSIWGILNDTNGAKEGAKTMIEEYQKKLNDAKTAYEQFAKALLNNTDIDTLLNELFPDEKEVTAKVMTLEEALAMAAEDIEKVLEEDLAKLDDSIVIDEQPTQLAEKKVASQRATIAAKELSMRKELNQTILMEEEERERAEYEIRMRFNEEKMKLLKQALDDTSLSLEERGKIEIEAANLEIEIERQKYEEQKRLRDKEVEEHNRAEEEKTRKEKEEADKRKETANKLINVTQAGLSATKDILDKVAEGYEADGEISEEEAKKLKAIRYSTTVIDMMQGIVSAIASVAGGGPAGWIAGGIQAAAIAATGIMSLNEIKKQDFSTMNNAPIATTAVNPTTMNSAPFEMVRNVTSASEVDALNQDTRVYVVESDITNAVNKQKVRVQESTF